jgi:outer membrane protein assembly factor BamA
VQVVGTAQLREDDVRAALRTRAADGGFRLLGGASAATREQLEADAERIRALYRGRGFLDVAVAVAAAPSREGLGAAWAAAAALGADQDAGELFVRFTVTEGTPTLVDAVAVEFAGPHVAAEAEVRGQLAIRPGEPYQLAALEAAGRRLQDWYWRLGRPRARVTLDVSFPTRHRAVATYRVEERGPVRVGKVVVRGNFRTRPWVVLEELGLPEGALLNDERYARGLRRLRGTGLFSAVAVTLLDFDDVALPSTNVLVRVEERHDVRAYLDAEAGYSDQKKVYARLAPSIPNLLGVGWALEAGVTLGFDLLGERDFATQVYEVTTRVPRWLTRRVTGGLGPDLEASLFLRVQDTERFGELQTFGGSLAAARVWQRAGGDGLDGRSLAATVRYDFRRRSRQEDAVRLAGNNGNVARSTIFNRTGAIGLTLSLDQRVDARGNLNPLSPERGFKLEGGVSLASPYLLSQDTFVKVSALGQWIRQLSSRLQLRLEGRFDHGIPLGGAVLLPEVERFFAGGDDTVRGFEQDRLATELVETALPPLGQVSQVEVLPAGGNLRVLTSVDLQVRLWRLGSVPLASAVFVDAGLITNAVRTVDGDSIRPAVGVALARVLSPFGPLSLEWAVPLRPGPYDPPLGRLHFVVALRY